MKRAKRVNFILDDETLKFSFIRSLNREADKYHKSQNPNAIENYNKKITLKNKHSIMQ